MSASGADEWVDVDDDGASGEAVAKGHWRMCYLQTCVHRLRLGDMRRDS